MFRDQVWADQRLYYLGLVLNVIVEEEKEVKDMRGEGTKKK